MNGKKDYKRIPYMLYSDSNGRIYEHPYYRMTGISGTSIVIPAEGDLIPMPEYSKLFFIPDSPPVGLDISTGKYVILPEIEIDGAIQKCHAVACFFEPGYVRTYLPAADYGSKTYTLPMWGYSAVGFSDNQYRVAGFRIEYNPRWDPRNYDDRDLLPAIDRFRRESNSGPLADHLVNCAVNNHCFAAKNLFLKRWEAPLPVSRSCNADCLGCLSLQPEQSCESSHQRISFRPGREEVTALALNHLLKAPGAIVSFGQGCEGEPLTEYELIADSIRAVRQKTEKGTINLNTNGSWPERIRKLAESGLDSIRISMNSARPAFYRAYYRPRGYDFEDVVSSISVARETGLFTMINYLVFPGVTDQEDEIEALCTLIRRTGVNFIHFKNLNIDPQLYMSKMPVTPSRAVGMKRMVEMLRDEFPEIELGYFNQPVR